MLMHDVKTFSVPSGDGAIVFETGKLAGQAQGAVTMRFKDMVILTTVGVGEGRPGMNFFPLVIEFEPRTYAMGRIKHNKVNKREGRRSDRDILMSRVTDRPLRPMFPKGVRSEVQVINTLLQTEGEYLCSPFNITAASIAIQLAGLPFEASVSAVHVGKDESGELILWPTFEQAENNGLDLVVAGTEDSVMMVEAGADLITDEEMLVALEFAHAEVKRLCQAQAEFLSAFDIEPIEVKIEGESDEFAAAVEAVNKVVSESDLDGVRGETKQEVKKKMKVLQTKIKETYAEQIEAEELSLGDLMKAFDKAFAKNMRNGVFSTGKRVDGRAVDVVRPLYTEAGVYNRLHGSGLFQRGETQVLSVLTLAGPDHEQYNDDAFRDEYRQRYIHHYNFPPYSVGETRPLRGPGRREIGHGALAERALKYVVPTAEEGYAYMTRVVSEVLACNGSSSMASVCGSTLALMDGGVPLKAPIAGVAMGLLMQDDGEYRILTDIQGLEDFDGDMDFKVAGDRDRITCLQLDIKIKGLDLSLLAEAMKQAKIGRNTILDNMLATIPESRSEMNEYAPLIETIKIREDQIKKLIGKGGETIQGLQATHEVNISVEDDGTTVITGQLENIKSTKAAIGDLFYEPSVGDKFLNGVVKNVVDFGCFIEYHPGNEALLHVSGMSKLNGGERVGAPSDVVSVGDIVPVEIIEKDRQGRYKLGVIDV